jgi:8-oxo-dGTP pyrophosphatase MutT (NUDIX family)
VTSLQGRVDGRVQSLTVGPDGSVLDAAGRPVRGEVLFPSYDPTLGLTASLHLDAALRSPVLGFAWRDDGSMTHEEARPRSVRDAGFAGYVGSQDTEDLEDELGEGGDEFDEDLYDRVTPEPTAEERAHYDEEGDYPDSYLERHDQAYAAGQAAKKAESHPDEYDDDLHTFVAERGSDGELWRQHGSYGQVPLTKPVYATQSHVAQAHIDRYLDDPHSTSWHQQRYGPAHPGNEYLGDDAPMFVTHQGRMHVTEGHHRVAAALQRGERSIAGYHFNLDKHPHGWDDETGEYAMQRRPALASLRTAADDAAVPSHAGVAMVAADTGRVLMLQRSYADEEDPARGRWEMPGGGIEDGDANPWEAAKREWSEEIGQPFPDEHEVVHWWPSPDGVYAGHVVVIPRESDVALADGRVTVNPDDPDGDDSEQAAWWEVEHARDNPALRDEVADSPWEEIEMAGGSGSNVGRGGEPHEASMWDLPFEVAGGTYANEDADRAAFYRERVGTWAPDQFGDLDVPAQEAGVEDDPEHALPVTYGGDEDPVGAAVMARLAQIAQTGRRPGLAGIVPDTRQYASTADLEARAAGIRPEHAWLLEGPSGSHAAATDEIAAAAQAGLARTAHREFSPAERGAIIGEGEGGAGARNLAALDLSGTHYEMQQPADLGQDDPWGWM